MQGKSVGLEKTHLVLNIKQIRDKNMIPLIIGGGILYAMGAIFGAGVHSTAQPVVVQTPPPVVQSVPETSPVVESISPTYHPIDIRATKQFQKAKKLLETTGRAY